MPLDDSDNPLAIEIRQEMAETYFAACRKMVDSLEALKASDRSVKGGTSKQQIERRTKLLEDAAERVHFVIIQREAMKFSHYDGFLDDYEVPPDVRARIGQFPQK